MRLAPRRISQFGVWSMLLATCMAGCLLTASAEAGKRHSRVPKIRVLVKPAAATAGIQIVISGQVKNLSRRDRVSYRIDLQVRGRQKRKKLAFKTRASSGIRGGKFRLKYRVPRAPGVVNLRLRLRKGHRVCCQTKRWKLQIRPPVAPTPRGSQTLVLDATTIAEAPEPGQPGQLKVLGNLDVRPGDILAIAAGPATPYGFLGKVVSVVHGSSTTTLQTVPATLPEALPEGSFRAEIDPEPLDSETAGSFGAQGSSSTPGNTGASGVQVQQIFNCGTSGEITVGGTAFIDPFTEISASWSLFSGPKVRYVEHLDARGDISVEARSAASCDLEPKTLFMKRLRPYGFWAGPVPVVILPVVTSRLTGGGSIEGRVGAGINGSLTAYAGIDYFDRAAHPVGGFDPILRGGALSEPEGSGHLGAAIVTTFDVLVYGVAGPQVSVSVGLAMDANLGQAPPWALTAPLSVDSRLGIPVLDVSTPQLHIYDHTFPLAEG